MTAVAIIALLLSTHCVFGRRVMNDDVQEDGGLLSTVGEGVKDVIGSVGKMTNKLLGDVGDTLKGESTSDNRRQRLK